MADLQKQKLVKYFTVVPEKVIPEHLALTKDFEKDLKSDAFTHPEVEVETASNLAVRFNKQPRRRLFPSALGEEPP